MEEGRVSGTILGTRLREVPNRLADAEEEREQVAGLVKRERHASGGQRRLGEIGDSGGGLVDSLVDLGRALGQGREPGGGRERVA